jgi:hypothetical protein
VLDGADDDVAQRLEALAEKAERDTLSRAGICRLSSASSMRFDLTPADALVPSRGD